MKNIFQKLALVTAGIALIYTVVGAKPTQAANIITEDFTVNLDGGGLDTGGSLAGNTYIGSFNYNADTLASTGFTAITDFSFNFPGFSGTLEPSGLPHTPVFDGTDLSLFYAPPPAGSATAFLFSLIGYYPFLFAYGTTKTVGNLFIGDGFGTVTYTAHPIASVPEPSDSAALAVLALGGLLIIKKLSVQKTA